MSLVLPIANVLFIYRLTHILLCMSDIENKRNYILEDVWFLRMLLDVNIKKLTLSFNLFLLTHFYTYIFCRCFYHISPQTQSVIYVKSTPGHDLIDISNRQCLLVNFTVQFQLSNIKFLMYLLKAKCVFYNLFKSIHLKDFLDFLYM